MKEEGESLDEITNDKLDYHIEEGLRKRNIGARKSDKSNSHEKEIEPEILGSSFDMSKVCTIPIKYCDLMIYILLICVVKIMLEYRILCVNSVSTTQCQLCVQTQFRFIIISVNFFLVFLHANVF